MDKLYFLNLVKSANLLFVAQHLGNSVQIFDEQNLECVQNIKFGVNVHHFNIFKDFLYVGIGGFNLNVYLKKDEKTYFEEPCYVQKT